MQFEVKMVCSGNGAIGWKLLTDGVTGDEWVDVLAEVVLGHAPQQLSAHDLCRWNEAVKTGRGPDADADVSGIRWVVPADS